MFEYGTVPELIWTDVMRKLLIILICKALYISYLSPISGEV